MITSFANTTVAPALATPPDLGFWPASWSDDVRRRWSVARHFGDFTIAYATVCQPGLQHFADHRGYQAYAHRWGVAFALGDPVAEGRHHDGLIDDFCRAHPKSCFVNVDETTAARLSDRGFRVTQMGIDTILDLPTYTFAGKSKEPLRYAANWLERRQYTIRELTYDQFDFERVRDLSDAWRRTRTIRNREVTFLNRPLLSEDEPDVRKFFLFDANEHLQAFVFFDPVYEAGEVTGYSTVFKRRRPQATNYAEQGIMKHAIETFQAEGRKTVRLGLSPLADIARHSYPRNPLLEFWWSYAYRAGWVNRYFYNLQGHAQFKRRFRGIERPVFFASPVLFNDLRIVALLRLMGVL